MNPVSRLETELTGSPQLSGGTSTRLMSEQVFLQNKKCCSAQVVISPIFRRIAVVKTQSYLADAGQGHPSPTGMVEGLLED